MRVRAAHTMRAPTPAHATCPSQHEVSSHRYRLWIAPPRIAHSRVPAHNVTCKNTLKNTTHCNSLKGWRMLRVGAKTQKQATFNTSKNKLRSIKCRPLITSMFNPLFKLRISPTPALWSISGPLAARSGPWYAARRPSGWIAAARRGIRAVVGMIRSRRGIAPPARRSWRMGKGALPRRLVRAHTTGDAQCERRR